MIEYEREKRRRRKEKLKLRTERRRKSQEWNDEMNSRRNANQKTFHHMMGHYTKFHWDKLLDHAAQLREEARQKGVDVDGD